METNNANTTPKPSSLRWKILRQALLRRPSPLNSDEQSEVGIINRISRRTADGFNLIPFQLVDKLSDSRDARVCYTLPVAGSPKLYLTQRVDNHADLGDFEICNRYNIDNTGLVCRWPSEDVLAFYCLSRADIFRSKRVIELGSGCGLAGLVIAATTEALEVVISDGNPQVVDSLFKEFHKDLARTVKFLLNDKGPSEAIFFSPNRGNSLNKFLEEIKEHGLHFSITENYNTEVWNRHQLLMNGHESWPSYDKDHCFPVLIRITP